MNLIKVLLADDHAITREGTRRLLETEDDIAIIAEAADGDEATRLTLHLHPDILLLDINMPKRNGIAVARSIGASLTATRIVVLTGYGDSEQYAQALLHLGIHGYISKTASSRELIETLRAVHRGQRIFSVMSDAPGARTDDTDVARPTPREAEVLRLVADGLRNRDIARRLGSSERTVQFHLGNLFTKFHASSRTELVHHARSLGWV